MSRRMFYVEPARGGRAVISGETAKHLRKVLRVEEGQQYEVSDNERVFLGRVAEVGKDVVLFDLEDELPARVLPARISLYPALVKFDAFEWMLEKATELGVSSITPVESIRVERGLEQAAVKRMERWNKILWESGQQSRRATRPQLHPPAELKRVLSEPQTGARWFLDEDLTATPLRGALPRERASSDQIHVLIGPEGGWDPREQEAAHAAGWQLVSVGNQVLRAETAAIAVLALISALWQPLGEPRGRVAEQ